jgi:hypothetical protein
MSIESDRRSVCRAARSGRSPDRAFMVGLVWLRCGVLGLFLTLLLVALL